MPTNIMDVLGGFQGATIAGIDLVTTVKLNKKLTIKNTDPQTLVGIQTMTGENSPTNPMLDRVTKQVLNNNVMLFTNKNSNAYENMVKRRLEAEGKDPESFTLGKRAWGERIPGTPIVKHTKDGETKYYLEMIFNRAGSSSYWMDGREIDKSEILGLPSTKSNPDSQAGVDNKVVIRTVALDSITAIRYGGKTYSGSFFYE